MNSNAEPPVEKWDEPIQMHSNASETRGDTSKGLQGRKVKNFKFRLSSIPLDGGKTTLRLYEDPVIEVDHDKMECKVMHWEVNLPLTKVEYISRTLARRFVELYSKSLDERLNEQEEAHWLNIVQRVDYQSFCADRAAARYIEGTIIGLEPVITVDWHDGEREELSPAVARSINILNPGDRFGGWIKWDRNQRVKSIENIKLL